VLFRYETATVSVTVTSNDVAQRHSRQGVSEKLSRRLPSAALRRPCGSLMEGIRPSTLHAKSSRLTNGGATCDRPVLRRQESTCEPRESTGVPHMHRLGWHSSAVI